MSQEGRSGWPDGITDEDEKLLDFIIKAAPHLLPDVPPGLIADEKDKFEREELLEILNRLKQRKAGSPHGLQIVIDGDTSREELLEAVESRLNALLTVYGCNADADGWKRLALKLALNATLAGQPVMDISVRAPSFTQGRSTPWSDRNAYYIHCMDELIRNGIATNAKHAADILAKDVAPTLRNIRANGSKSGYFRSIYSLSQKYPYRTTPLRTFDEMVWAAMEVASEHLEEKARVERAKWRRGRKSKISLRRLKAVRGKGR